MANGTQTCLVIQHPPETVTADTADTAVRRAVRAAEAKTNAERLKRLFRSDLDRALPSLAVLRRGEARFHLRRQT